MNTNQIQKKKSRKSSFNDINVDSLQDIEKKKLEILYKLKNDIQNQINRGEIHFNEMENFNEFQKKINDLKNGLEVFDKKAYLKQLEDSFSSFEELMSKNKKKFKKTSRRI